MAVWCFYAAYPRFLPMSIENSNKLEIAFNKGQTSCQISVDHIVYEVHLTHLTQENKTTGFVRPIRRIQLHTDPCAPCWLIGDKKMSACNSAILNVTYFYWMTTRDIKYKWQSLDRSRVDFEQLLFSDLHITPPTELVAECEQFLQQHIRCDFAASDDNDEFKCPITCMPFKDPVICADGHAYERHAICLWLVKHSSSPFTRQHLPSTVVYPVYMLRNKSES